METQPRFRFRSLSLALRELEGCRSKSKLEEIVNFIELGQEYRKKKALINNKTDIITFISGVLHDNFLMKNTEGNFIVEEVIKEAAQSYMYREKRTYLWGAPEEEVELTELQRSLLIDGWKIQANKLHPVAAEELAIVPKRSQIAECLTKQGWSDAVRYLENIESALERASWEPANASCRTFLNELFASISRTLFPEAGGSLSEGQARMQLAEKGFFRTADKGKKLESEFVKSLVAMLGMEGAHVGISTMQNAIFNYHVSILTADFFLARLEEQVARPK